MAFWTLLPLRQRVQTYARVALPFSKTRTRWRFGSKRRFVATIEWLRLLPKPGFFPQIAQTLDIGGGGEPRRRLGGPGREGPAGFAGGAAKPVGCRPRRGAG